MLLAIDTSSGTSVAVVDRDAGVLSEVVEADTMRHAEVVGTLIREALDIAGVPVSALSGVVAGMGPGPFTGLRVGIAAAKAFAVGAGRPLVPVVSHDAIAAEHFGSGGSGPLLVVTDARRRERYWTAYSGPDELGLPVRLDGPGLAKPDQLPHAEFVRVDADVVSAGRLGMIAEVRFANKRPFDPDEPLYLRSPDVTLSAGPKRVSA
ncbi:tRNA (adenosine(37)-N6)-threonylcarbamoyltransferase complex dimerization subunit type 1 TsaB [Leifsonia sp. ZF2019]|uniref:tRNA (adenosine(37)-N6)-threonylcarbamoyltransferase complex dimerization subunit type 1 TsaB n=1 Tax=Leifsonia sp. ZF2019 TaxID=2781978 RepID=UPI001CC0BF56|nr:tRNA (adenosine(37)-N6)-threonylcarbamoyltransferase complex dimerization subunit type 1 TsaB [Leifsonia sp. ZF2019]UAJ78708.1 tRNA (adenosine(37)-N6)-threonylcarbamoyltransferase complex dimerization subunit type 1 TsaB [Leifsonia sp. ZF2019]